MTSGHQKRRSQYICFYNSNFTHLDEGSLVPPMCTHGGSSFPRIITLFYTSRRAFRSSYRILVPHTGSSYLVPDPCTSSGSSYLVPDPCTSYRILVPRTGSSYLVPDITYRFITVYRMLTTQKSQTASMQFCPLDIGLYLLDSR